MIKKKQAPTPEPVRDLEAEEAERKVVEMMGPAWRDKPMSEKPKQEPNPDPVEEPGSDIEELNKQLAEQIESSQPVGVDRAEDELELPSDQPSDQAEPPKHADPIDAMLKTDNDDRKFDGPAPVIMKKSFWDKIVDGYYRWWDNRVARYITLGVILLIIGLVIGVKGIRTAAMNLVGFRGSVAVTAVDGANYMPLKNARLIVDGREIKTNDKGKARLMDVRLGNQTAVVKKAGFADHTQKLQIGFRVSDLGDVTMKPTGRQMSYKFVDFLTGKPVTGVELSSGDASAIANDKGEAVITLAPGSDSPIKAEKTSYRTEKLELPDDDAKKVEVKLVPASKISYVKDEGGRLDIFSKYIDGQDDKRILEGTGLEIKERISILANSSSQYVAVESTRDDLKNPDGYLLSALTIVTTDSEAKTTIEHAEDIELLGWQGDTLLYKQVVAGTSARNPERQKVMAYDAKNDKRFTVASANDFLGVYLINDRVYHVSAPAGLVQSNIDGTGKKTIKEGEVWSVSRPGYGLLRLQLTDAWFDYRIGQANVETAKATVEQVRLYVSTPDGKLSAWARGDVQSPLSIHTVAAGKDKVLVEGSAAHQPVRWLNNKVVLYRAVANQSVEYFVVNVDGGEAALVADSVAG